MNLPVFMPENKLDLEACSFLESATDTEIQPYLSNLVEWLADSNWPVAQPIIERLSTIGDELAPMLIEILKEGDASWKYSLLTGIMLSCRPEVREMCMDEVLRIIENPSEEETFDEVNLVAIDVKNLRDRSDD